MQKIREKGHLSQFFSFQCFERFYAQIIIIGLNLMQKDVTSSKNDAPDLTPPKGCLFRKNDLEAG